MLERVGYYGIRASIVLYMTGNVLNMTSKEALEVYGLIASAIIIGNIIGALIGDLVIGNKKAVILGGIIQATGAFTLCLPTLLGLYLGLFLIVLGTGFYSSNMASHFGKFYLNKTKLLDSGFTLFYLAASLGGILGPIIIGYLFEDINWNLAFVTSGVFMLLSVIVPLNYSNDDDSENQTNYLISKSNTIYVISAILLIGVFWVSYEVSYYQTMNLSRLFSQRDLVSLPSSLITSMSSSISLPLFILFSILWSYYYTSQYIKLAIGLFLGVISFGILLAIPDAPSIYHFVIFILSQVLLGISEIFISPVTLSLITKHSNPKYLAIISSLAFIPMRVISVLVFFLFSDIIFQGSTMLTAATIFLVCATLGLIYFIFKENLLRE